FFSSRRRHTRLQGDWSSDVCSSDLYAVLRNRDYARYLTGRLVASLGQQMLVVAIDWELFKRTNSALALAFVGLSLMVPMILCTRSEERRVGKECRSRRQRPPNSK